MLPACSIFLLIRKYPRQIDDTANRNIHAQLATGLTEAEI